MFSFLEIAEEIQKNCKVLLQHSSSVVYSTDELWIFSLHVDLPSRWVNGATLTDPWASWDIIQTSCCIVRLLCIGNIGVLYGGTEKPWEPTLQWSTTTFWMCSRVTRNGENSIFLTTYILMKVCLVCNKDWPQHIHVTAWNIMSKFFHILHSFLGQSIW